MKFTIDEEICSKAHLDVHLLLTLLLINTGTDFNENLQELLDKQVLIKEDTLLGPTYQITQRWSDVVAGIFLDSEKDHLKEFDARLETLARELMDVFPSGKKEGTSLYWKGNVREIKLKLKKFFKETNNLYTDEQVLDAAKSYVASFNGDYRGMRVLKYFIWKDERKLDSEGSIHVEEISDLTTFLENADQDDVNNNWQDSIR